jgi:hypothetical protein
MAAGIPLTEFFVDGDPHCDLSYCPCPEKFLFAFVRQPLDVYRSYWRFKRARGWDGRNPFDVDCRADAFGRFVEQVLEKYPGWCSRMFEDYVGPRGREIAFVGRYERLADDLVTALRLGRVPFDEPTIRRHPPQNVSTWPTTDAVWCPELAERVRVAEAEAFERFGYASAPAS